MISYIKSRPLFISALGSIIVSVCGCYSVELLVAATILIICFLALAVIKGNKIFAIALCLALFTAISCAATLSKINNLNKFSNMTANIRAVVCNTDYESDTYYKSEIQLISSDMLPAGTKLSAGYKPKDLKNGRIITAKVKVYKVDEKYKSMCYSENIFLSGYLEDIEITDETDPIVMRVEGLRNYIKDAFFENMDYSEAATMCALVFGDREYFDDGFYNNVKTSGVAHVMVVSGMHLSLIVGMILRIADRFFGSGKFRALIILATVLLICALCGFTMSIMRAGVTYIIIAAGEWFSKPYSGDNALAGAVTFIMVFSPFAIFSVAFQLSALSTFGILAVALPVCKYMKSRSIIKNRAVSFVFETAVMSVSASVLTLPVIIYVFQYISIVSVITNLLITIPVGWCLSIGIVALILNLISSHLAGVVLFIGNYIVKYINYVINFLGEWKYSAVKVPKEFAFAAIVLVVGILWILIACKKRIDMVKLKELNDKVIKEGGRTLKWQSFTRKR